jgi:hypothetical protein
MNSNRSESSSTLRIASLAAAFVLASGMLALQSRSAALAAGTCRVRNVSLGTTYGPGDGGVLQQAIDEAHVDNVLSIRGSCVGNFTIASILILKGKATTDYPIARLDGNASGTVLRVESGAEVNLFDLEVTNGHQIGSGGGIYNAGNVEMRGATVVTGNWAGQGGGVYDDHGVLLMADTSSIENNYASSIGGGVVDRDGVIKMVGHTSVSSNTSNDSVGGIWEYSGKTMMSQSATVSGNADFSMAGGIEIDSGGHLIMRGSSSIQGNSSHTRGGVYVAGAYVRMFGSSSVRDNTGGFGGGVGQFGGRIILKDASTITGNQATVHGGGLLTSAGHLVMVDQSSIAGNVADSDADGSGRGGGIAYCPGVSFRGVTRGGNVIGNHLGDGTRSNISSLKC